MVAARVTVLMGVYNPPLGMLDDAIDSIVRQSLPAWEFLIVDDGSTEPQGRLRLKEWAKLDSRIRILWEPHRGLTASLNRGLLACSTEYVARQDADDWSSLDRLDTQVALLDSRPDIAACGSNAWLHQENGRRLWSTRLPTTPEQLLSAFSRSNPIVHGSTMFRREAALEVGGYCEDFRCSQDYDFFWRLAERFGVANLHASLYHYRYTGGSISAARATEQLRAHQAIRLLANARHEGRRLTSSEALLQVDAGSAGEPGIYRARLKQADHKMLAGCYREAAGAYLKLLSEHPANPIAWAKIARLGVFYGFPAVREACFR